MDNRSEIEQKLGVPLGEKRNPGLALDAFKQKGISRLHHDTIANLKKGKTSGEKTVWRLDASKILEEDNAGLKNSFYEQITQIGLQDRRFNTAPQRAHVLKSDHFVEDIAEALGQQDPQAVRRCIRAMRTDIVLAQVGSSDPALLRQFSDSAESYIDANHRIPPSMRSKVVLALEEAWDHKTIESFYRSLYGVANERGIGAWTPYEMDVLSLFYSQQTELGNHLTPFDRLVLDSYMKGLLASQIIGEITRSTGIRIDGGVIEQHRNALIYGRPIYLSKQ